MAAELPAAGLVSRAATAGCPAYAGNDGGSPNAPVANAVVRRFDRGMGEAAPPQIVDLIGNHMASGDNRPGKMIIRA